MSATSLRPSMPPAALHHEVNTWARLSSCGSLVNPTSVSTPTVIWLEVTPWSVAPVALPGWQTSFRSPKLPGVVWTAAEGESVAVGLPLESARPQPAASRAAAARTAKAARFLVRLPCLIERLPPSPKETEQIFGYNCA